MKGTALVMFAVLLVAVAAAQDFGGGARKPGAGDYAAETGGALLGGALVGAGATVVLGFAGAVVASGTSQDEWAGLGGFIIGGAAGVALGYPLGCGLGTTIAGRALRADGNTGAAYGGAYAGLTLGALAGLVARRWDVAVPAMVVLSPAGAVIVYNTGVPGTSSQNQFGARLAQPTLALRTRVGPDRQRYSAFDCRLVTVRF